MALPQELAQELNILLQFNLASTQSGIKVHSNAAPEMIAAAKRLFNKGLITQEDGGYLTNLGHEAAEHAEKVISILKNS